MRKLTPLQVLARGWRRLCPRCGVGRVFKTRLESHESCLECDWPLEKAPGQWLGGTEINMLVTFPFSVAAFLVASAFFGFNLGTSLFGFFAAALFSAWFFQRARSLFYAIDYLVDPKATALGDGGGSPWPDDDPHGDDGGLPAAPVRPSRTPAPRHRSQPRETAGSRR